MAKKKKEKKEMVFIIEYRVCTEGAEAIGDVMDKMREFGTAEIIDCGVEPVVDA